MHAKPCTTRPGPRGASARCGSARPPANKHHAFSGSTCTAEPDTAMEELLKLTALLPPVVRCSLEAHPSLPSLVEVVMDLGRPSMARFPEGDVGLSAVEITESDLLYATEQVGEFDGDNRAGIDATLHRISCIRNRQGRVVGLTCRVGRAIPGTADLVEDLAHSGKSILLLGPPGVGKTTAIRDLARLLGGDWRRRVVVVDTNNEIGGDGDVPHPAIGGARRMQVAHPLEQHRVMIEAVENHMPEVIIIDEISTQEECLACRTIAQRGVQLIATAHGAALENVLKNPALSDLVGGIQSVTLGDDSAKRRGSQKSILERKEPPCFDVAVEMLARGSWKVHLDVAGAVDAVLGGAEARGQLRERDEQGRVVEVQYVQRTYVASDPGEMFGMGTWATPSFGGGSAWGLPKGGAQGVTKLQRLGSTVISQEPAQQLPQAAPPGPTTPSIASSTTAAAAAAGAREGSPAGQSTLSTSPQQEGQRQQQELREQQRLAQQAQQLKQWRTMAAAWGGSGSSGATGSSSSSSSSSSGGEPVARGSYSYAADSQPSTSSSSSTTNATATAGSSGSTSSSSSSTGSGNSGASGRRGPPVRVYLLMDRGREERVWSYIQAADPQSCVVRAEELEAADVLVASLPQLRANSKVRNTAKKLRLPTISLKATSASSLARRLAPHLGLDPFLAVGAPEGWAGGAASQEDDDEEDSEEEGEEGPEEEESALSGSSSSSSSSSLPGDEWAGLMAAAVEESRGGSIGREYATQLLNSFLEELPQCSTGAVVIMAGGLGRAKGRRRLVAACREQLEVLALECSRRVGEMSGADVARMVEGFAALGFCPAGAWVQLVEARVQLLQQEAGISIEEAAALAGHLQQLCALLAAGQVSGVAVAEEH